ncbi:MULTISPECIES: type I toxin-antitoxin system Fst family toxin [Enterococcus]|nr:MULTISPECIES: type I toxin-antitoxin system Fst family toxin [Enterococcus]MDN6003983.1 type I toxin-antitoxin system Fst family toxin [Enterococcus sp.]MDN6562379.1 type I toxin-antitoxin system Fst family toxin [Enterococcus sp.]MDN6616680.1 type I toxin-antitoxin system Fst family toxin [Enterococcus sp.]MDN6776590.1 type I toxin-antitoxin system Fst family toxin [Enterococcus sp.]MDN6829713.1 type I toxin-antitoxin system Fst family toxin [Enterococcus sp.]
MSELTRYLLAPIVMGVIVALFNHWLRGRDP